MGRWRSRILFGLIVYFGGFATAIYYLAPVSQDAADRTARQKFSLNWPGKADISSEKCKAVAGQFGDKMRNAVTFAEEQAKRVAELYKTTQACADETSGTRAAAD
ncbi:MAG TPA: hypothetical protein PKB02_13840 [Anaerohalosphaeraceae bacterium]|jgi:hypothetical protein|nr:hypothetical protein [Anaerohalosphaeraceae bacterium]